MLDFVSRREHEDAFASISWTDQEDPPQEEKSGPQCIGRREAAQLTEKVC